MTPTTRPRSRFVALVAAAVLAAGVSAVVGPVASAAVTVTDESGFRTAWATDAVGTITLGADIDLACPGPATRASATPVTVEGAGHVITQTCAGAGALEQTTAGGAVTLHDLGITGGTVGVAVDGPLVAERIRVAGQAGTQAFGVGASGDVTLVDSTVDDVSATGSVAYGVFAEGDVDVSGSTVRGIRSSAASGLVVGVLSDQVATVDRSRVSDVGDALLIDAYGVVGVDGLHLTDSVVSGIEGSQAVGAVGHDPVVTRTWVWDVAATEFAVGILGSGESDVVVHDSYVAEVVASGFGTVGIFGGDVVVTGSTITALQGGELVVAILANGNEYAARVVNSTITGNRGVAVMGGALTIVYSDIIGNGGSVFPSGASVDLSSLGLGTEAIAAGDTPVPAQVVVGDRLVMFGSVISDPLAGDPNCSAHGDATVLASAGYNLADDTTCALTATGDRQEVGLDSMIGPLEGNGGPTPTRSPQPGSPALEAIPAAACQSGPAAGITTDQRGEPRPGFTDCDIGAVELQPAPPVVIEPTFTG